MAQLLRIEDSNAFEAGDDLARRRGSAKRRLILLAAAQPARTLDISAFLDAFSEANLLARNGPEYEVRVVSGGLDRNLTSRDGLRMQASVTYRECFAVADTLLVTGSDGCEAQTTREQFIAWLKWQASQSRRIGAVSSGAILLAEAGLLNGRRVTTHWQFHDALATRYPQALLERDVIYVRDGNLYSCAGATAGLDLALSMIEEDLGPSLVMDVAKSMLLSFRRSGGADQISAALRAQEVHGSPIADLLVWLPDHLQEDLSIKSLARRSAMSPRNFARIFTRQVGLTPARHIENLRLEAARFQLESSDLTVEGVAFAAGFENGETLRRLFIRRLGVTPGRYRASKARLARDLEVPHHRERTNDSESYRTA